MPYKRSSALPIDPSMAAAYDLGMLPRRIVRGFFAQCGELPLA
jgi:hypothetical protein